MPKGRPTRSVASLGERTRPAIGPGSCLIANRGEISPLFEATRHRPSPSATIPEPIVSVAELLSDDRQTPEWALRSQRPNRGHGTHRRGYYSILEATKRTGRLRPSISAPFSCSARSGQRLGPA